MPDETKKPVNQLTLEQLQELTEKRNTRCEGIVLMILKAMLDSDVLLSDRFYIEQMVKQQLDVIFRSVVMQYHNDLLKMIEDSLVNSVERATEILWKGKDNKTVSLNDIDKVLKSATKEKEIKEIPLEEK